MREPRLIETREVALDEIRIVNRLRPASDASVASIMASVTEMGVALTPIALRRKRDRLELVAGLHRLEAYRRLGRATIRAEIWDATDDWARLAEIDENLAGAELSVLELARFLAQRKRLYEQLHPETKAGNAGALARWDDATETVSFASAIAEKRGITPRHVRSLTRFGQSIDPEASAILARQPIPPTFRELGRLCVLHGMEQARAAKMVRDGTAATLKAAIAAVEPARAPVEQLPAEERAFRDLRERFDRAPMAAKRRFIAHLFEHHDGLIDDAAPAGGPLGEDAN